MRITISSTTLAATLLLAGCSTHNSLTSAGQAVRLADEKPGADCQLLGHATGEQSNWLSGNNESGSLLGAANQLREKAAAMGGNVLYNVNSPSQTLWSSFVPVASQMSGDVYKCPN